MAYPDGTLVKASGPEIARMEGGQRRGIPDPATFTCMGLDWNAVKTITDAEWNQIPQGSAYLSRADGMAYGFSWHPGYNTTTRQYDGNWVVQSCALHRVWQPGDDPPVGEIFSKQPIQILDTGTLLAEIPLGSGSLKLIDITSSA